VLVSAHREDVASEQRLAFCVRNACGVPVICRLHSAEPDREHGFISKNPLKRTEGCFCSTGQICAPLSLHFELKFTRD
jgi:hypothetical protein